MRVILREPVVNLGQTGEMVSVKSGYGRNFLIPKGLAVLADEKNTKQIEHQKRLLAQKIAKELVAAETLVEAISKQHVTVSKKAGESDKLFGAVTTADIAAALAENGLNVDKRQISLNEPIKALGEYTIGVKVRKDSVAKFKLSVTAEE